MWSGHGPGATSCSENILKPLLVYKCKMHLRAAEVESWLCLADSVADIEWQAQFDHPDESSKVCLA